MKTDLKYIKLFWLIYAILCIFMAVSCQKPEQPETYCYECRSTNYPAPQTFCGVSADTMQIIIDWRAKYLYDTLVCEEKVLNLEIH
jgi:hypothetical protein